MEDAPITTGRNGRAATHFRPGNPGRPKGSVGGRAHALMILDAVMAQEDNKTKLRAAMQAEFDKAPMRFFRNVIIPLLPRDMVVKLREEGVIQWVSFLRPATPAPPEVIDA